MLKRFLVRQFLALPCARLAVAGLVGIAFVDNPKSPYRKFWAMVIAD
jgi:hypothetical protein